MASRVDILTRNGGRELFSDGQVPALVLGMIMNTSRLLVATILLAGVLAGCANPSARAPGASVAHAQPQSERPPLTVGMPAEEVRRLWGDPNEIRPSKDPSDNAEVWVYEGRVTTHAAPAATSVRQVMSYNPVFEGGMVATTEPVYSIQTRRIMHIDQIVMMHGKVVEAWQTRRELPVMIN